MTLVDLLQRHAAAFPGRRLYTFLADGESESGSLTYGQLDAAARSLAAALLETARRGDRAILLYPVGLEYLVGFFGCLYAGIVAVPAYPLKTDGRGNERVRRIIADCAPRLVLTCERLVERVRGAIDEAAEGSGSPLRVLGTDERIGSDGAASLRSSITPETLAFLQYTSASTAEAKGVRITHANLMGNEAMIRKAMAHDESSHFVSWLPPYHDMGLIGNLLQPLYLGASCAFMSPAAFIQKPARWLSAISSYRARTSGAPNFAYALCVKNIQPEEEAGLDLSCWTVAYCGAEVVDAAVLERFAERFAACGFRKAAFYACYGLAEATLMVSGGEAGHGPEIVDADPELLDRGLLRERPAGPGRRLVGCGTATAGSEIRIVDPTDHRLLPDGEVGEIWIRGAHVADGYWNNPDESRSTFGGRLEGHTGAYLRTGDLGALLRDELYVVGRIKEKVIHQGRTLYPTDLENVVDASAAGAIDASAAFAVPGAATEDLVVVTEVARHGFAAERADEIARTIAWALYRAFEIVPSRLVFARKASIPRTSSGKKQRLLCSQLLMRGEVPIVAEWNRATGWAAEAADRPDDDPRWLAKLISRLTGLSLERILHGAGGANAWSLDSLRAVEIVHQIERRTGAVLPVSLLYEATSLAALLRAIEVRSVSGGAVAADAGPASDESQRQIGVTPGQEAVWFAQQVHPTSPAFHLKWAVHVAAALDGERLREAVRAIVARHEGLRCQFSLSPAADVAASVRPPGAVDCERVDGAGDAVVEQLDAECDRQFRLDRDLLVRVRHTRVRDGDLVAFSLHHLIADLWSCALFAEEVLDEYAGVPLEPAPSYRAYVRHVLDVERHASPYLDDWRSRLTDAPLLDPVDVLTAPRSRPIVRCCEGATVTGALDPASSRAVLDAARRYGVSRQVLLQSVYGIWMWSLTGLEDFLSGALTSGRTRAKFSRVQGLLTNPFAVRFRIGATTTLGTVVAATREQVLGAIEREDYPFQSVVRALAPPRELGRTPFFQNMFVYQQLPQSSPLAGCVVGGDSRPCSHRGLELRCVPLSKRSARYDFTLYGMEVDSKLAWEAVYDTALFDRPQVATMLARFEALVRRVASAPAEAPVGEVAKTMEPVA